MAWEPDYVTTTQLGPFEGITASAPSTDVAARLQWAVTAASRAVDREVSKKRHRQFGLLATPEARYFTPQWRDESRRWVVEIDDVQTTVGMVVEIDQDEDDVHELTLSASDYVLRPRSAPSLLRPWTQIAIKQATVTLPAPIPDSVKVTARWGWTTVPVTVEQATLLQANRFFTRRDSPYGVAGSPESGSTQELESEVDPDVALMLRSYRKLWETP